jgi:3-phenylpropionate/trans-cinnamate dioxygenase ferredoxin subunit
MSSGSFTAVTAAENIADKSFSCFQVNGVAVVICRFRDEYFALENQCSHAQSTFDEGRLRAYNLICPLHGASFDIRNGTPTGLPAKLSISSFPIRVTDGIIEISI